MSPNLDWIWKKVYIPSSDFSFLGANFLPSTCCSSSCFLVLYCSPTFSSHPLCVSPFFFFFDISVLLTFPSGSFQTIRDAVRNISSCVLVPHYHSFPIFAFQSAIGWCAGSRRTLVCCTDLSSVATFLFSEPLHLDPHPSR